MPAPVCLSTSSLPIGTRAVWAKPLSNTCSRRKPMRASRSSVSAGTQHTGRLARLIAWLVHISGKHVGLACSEGLYLDGRQVEAKDSCPFGSRPAPA